MKLGFSTKCLSPSNWYREAPEFGFEAIEIARRKMPLHLIPHYIEKLKEYLSGADLSMHSLTTWLFTGVPEFEEAELATLKAEVKQANMLGAKQLIFHSKHDKYTDEEISRIRPLLDYSKKQGVEMINESNSRLDDELVLDILERIPDLNYNLDIGHLNCGMYHKNFKGDMDDFLDQIKDRIAYVHAHNNDGTKDQHRSMDDGTLDWRHVLDKIIDGKRLNKIIIESNKLDDMLKSKVLLEEYLKNSL